MKRIVMMIMAFAVGWTLASSVQAQDVTADEARAIAKEAYIYGYPMLDGYRIQHAYFVNTGNPEYKAPWNQLTRKPFEGLVPLR